MNKNENFNVMFVLSFCFLLISSQKIRNYCGINDAIAGEINLINGLKFSMFKNSTRQIFSLKNVKNSS